MKRLSVLFCFLVACSSDSMPFNNDGIMVPDSGSDSESDVGTGTGDATDDSGSGPDASPEPQTASVFEAGPYQVGYRVSSVTYAAFMEPQRRLRLAIWYPTDETEGVRSDYGNLIPRADIWKDAPLTEANAGPFPVLVFSHGNNGLAEQNYFMTEFFASHGFVVIAPDHTGNTFRDAGGVSLDSAGVRPTDITATLDYLYNDDELKDLITDEVVMSGHSFGGYTTLAATGGEFQVDAILTGCDNNQVDPSLCALFSEERLASFRAGFLDERIDVAIPQTPAGAAIFGPGLRLITIPTLLFTGARDATLPNSQEGDPIWNFYLGSDHRRVDLTTAGHFTFSNMCAHFGSIAQVQNDGCNDTFVPYADAHDVVNAYSLAFVRKHLWGDDSHDALLDGDEMPIDVPMTVSKK